LPDMKPGDVFNGESVLTNHGLVRADELVYTLPEDDQFFRYELLAPAPDSLEAKQSVTLPYRVTCISSPNQSDPGATGGGCEPYTKCGGGLYRYQACPEDPVTTKGSARQCFLKKAANCDGGGDTGPGKTPVRIVGPKSPDYEKIVPKPGKFDSNDGKNDCKPCPENPDCPDRKDGDKDKHKNQEVGCSVNTFTRRFSDEAIDIAVKVKGGMVVFKRFYDGLSWGTDLERSTIDIRETAVLIPRKAIWEPEEMPSHNYCGDSSNMGVKNTGFFGNGDSNGSCHPMGCPPKDAPIGNFSSLQDTYRYPFGSVITRQEETWR
ncbi:MAG: hypothetical protein GY859_25370, partial [Desulfobacterales bacterium]|nr:hypothetical protein [Desulfobacterales bacterium]